LNPKVVGRRDGDTPRLIASTKKIEAELDWRPEFDLAEMIDSAWAAEKRFGSGN
jgi:UDP-glucose 4-epimerase